MLSCGAVRNPFLPMKLSIVLPCYNEEANIGRTVKEVNAWMEKSGTDGEIIVSDDGSKDRSPQILAELRKTIPRLRVVTRPRNGGYGMAVRDGLDAATTEWIAYMDSDGQFKPEDLEKLMTHSDTYGFITGRRAHRADPFIRNMFGKVLGAVNVVVLGLWVRDVNCGMKMFRKDIWVQVRPTHNVEKLFNTEMFRNLKRKGIPWTTVNVPHYPRTAGTPTGGSIKMVLQTFKELWDLRRS
jgi:glycosyltransferase involved in cell wall biosynthesis